MTEEWRDPTVEIKKEVDGIEKGIRMARRTVLTGLAAAVAGIPFIGVNTRQEPALTAEEEERIKATPKEDADEGFGKDDVTVIPNNS